MDSLLNATLPFAQDQLAKRGNFVPFGAVVTVDGAITMLGGYVGDPKATSRDLLELLVDGARQNSASYRAVAIVADGLIGGKQDAIRIDVEHRDGHAIASALPYTKRRFGRGIDYGELIAADGQRRIWT
jgi:hypothetical protein